MNRNFTKYAFTESVKKAQEKFGSRHIYKKMDFNGLDQSYLTQREMSFVSERDSFYMATVGENGWPYVQFRGGPKGFLKVIDGKTLGFADFRGNMQYISTGNIGATGRATLILLDYPSRRRLKLWAETEIFDPKEKPELFRSMEDNQYDALVERLFIFHVKAFDWNCPQHITPRYTLEEIKNDLLPNNLDIIRDCCPEIINQSDTH